MNPVPFLFLSKRSRKTPICCTETHHRRNLASCTKNDTDPNKSKQTDREKTSFLYAQLRCLFKKVPAVPVSPFYRVLKLPVTLIAAELELLLPLYYTRLVRKPSYEPDNNCLVFAPSTMVSALLQS